LTRHAAISATRESRVEAVKLNEIQAAASALALGRLVAFPTETVYGLGADASNPEAVARVYQTKGRPSSHPLIIHISWSKSLGEWAVDVHDYAEALADEFWPGPMTLVLKRSTLAADYITGGQDTVAVRVPNHDLALAILTEFEAQGGKGVVAPSANRFGRVSPTTAAAVRQELGQFLQQGDLIIDGGASRVGIESTIVDCTGVAPRVLRPGAITTAQIEDCTGVALATAGPAVRVSGSLKSHYAPTAKVVLNQEPKRGDGLLALSNHPTPEGVIRLAAPESPEEYARQLYAALRQADELGLARVVAILPEGQDLAVAISDRLTKASH